MLGRPPVPDITDTIPQPLKPWVALALAGALVAGLIVLSPIGLAAGAVVYVWRRRP
jgi:hypothetical protein